MKRIAIMTTGGDCSGLNTVINRLVTLGLNAGHTMIGILDGTDGLTCENAPNFIEFNYDTLPIEQIRTAGSFLKNGAPHALNFKSAAKSGQSDKFESKMKKSLRAMKLDAIVLVGGNGSLSLANSARDVYGNIQLVCIPKTIDMDIPLTDTTIGFATAVQQLTSFCDQLMLTARSHHRWFVVQSMGRDVGALALHGGVAAAADVILIPEFKFKVDNVISKIKSVKKNQNRDYGIIMVAEGISVRGHSGRPADIISRELTKAGISNRTAYPEHTQRAGDTTAADRIIATQMATCAMDAIENNETYMMVTFHCGDCVTVPLSEMLSAGDKMPDPNIPGMLVSNAYVPDDSPLLSVAFSQGIYIGELK